MTREAKKHLHFERLVAPLAADLFRYALWLCGNDALAKDLVQETLLRAWRAMDKLNDEGAAKSWLITILRREYARTFERKVPQFCELDSVVIEEQDELTPEQRAERDLLRQQILDLAPLYREPLLLQVVMGLSCEEIAEQLEISKSAVMTQLFRAREQLKSTLHEDGITGNIHGLF